MTVITLLLLNDSNSPHKSNLEKNNKKCNKCRQLSILCISCNIQHVISVTIHKSDIWPCLANPQKSRWGHVFGRICKTAVETYRTFVLSSSRIQTDTLGHTLTPFCSVCRQFFGFIPGDAHILQISSDNVHPVFPWPSQLPLVAPQFPL